MIGSIDTHQELEERSATTSDYSIVAIVGRPNVGKSSLFNRLIKDRRAVVHDEPGTTRDRLTAIVTWEGRSLILVDTGGLEMGPDTKLKRMMRLQVERAIQEADLLLFLVDAKDGLMPADEEVADLLRKSSKPLLLGVNKVENQERLQVAPEFYRLGMGEPIPISAYHGDGIQDLMERILSRLPPTQSEVTTEKGVKIAIVGRPNVGKSMLLNTLLGEERAVVDETPGTTRDATDTLLHYEGESFILIDTAGLRRRGHISQGVERYSSLRTLRAIQRADVAVLVLDASDLAANQDTHIASFIQEASKGVILAVNKWDLAGSLELKREECLRLVRGTFKFMPYAPIKFISAKTGMGTKELLAEAKIIHHTRKIRIPTHQLNQVVGDALASSPPPTSAGRSLKILFVTQVQVEPPTFVFFVNNASILHFSYRRYLENSLRKAFSFQGTPISMLFRTRSKE